MAAYLYPGIKSLQLVLDKPYDAIRTTDVRDDLASVKVWYSLVSGFNPNNGEGTLVPSGNSLSVIITGLTPNTRYYVKYAFISAIDEDEVDPAGPTGPGSYTVSPQLTAVVFDENVTVYGNLTNDPVPIVTKADGTGGDFTNARGVFRVFNLSQEVTGAGPVYGIKANSIDSLTGVIIDGTTGAYSCTGLTDDGGNVTFTATYNNVVVEQTWNVYRAKAGETAPLIQLSSPNKEFLYKDQFATSAITPSTTITARLVNLTGTPTFTVEAFTREGTSLGAIAFTQSTNTITITKAQFDALGVTIGTARVTATLGTVSDVLTLYRINDGSEQITVELTNESHQIPTYQDGTPTPSSYEGSGTIIKVKEGNTYLDVDNSAPYGNGTWRIGTPIDDVNIVCDTTPGIFSNFIEFDKHSAMDVNQDVAYIDYTIIGKTSTGKDFTIVKRQSFAKSKEGLKGANARAVSITAPAQIFVTAKNSTTPSPTSIVLTAVQSNFVNPTYTWLVDGVAATSTIGTASANTFTLNSFAPVGSKTVRVTATETVDGVAYSQFDIFTVYSLREGDDAFIGGLSNENQTISCDSAGDAITGQFPVTSNFYAALGTTFLSASTNPVVTFAKVSYNGSTTASDCTINSAGLITINALNTNSATAVFTATIYGGTANAKTITKELSLNKSKDGAKGETGEGTAQIYRRSASQPATPAASATTPSGWFDTVAGATGTDPLWTSFGKRAVGASNYTWQTPVRVEGTTVLNPSLKNATGYLYFGTASANAPAAPTASGYNFDTGEFTSLTAGWSTAISTAPASATLKMWAVRYSVQETVAGGTQTITISSVFTHQNFNGLVTFTNETYVTPTGATTAANNAISNSTVIANKVDAAGATSAANTAITNSSVIAGKANATDVFVANTTTIDGGKISTGSIDVNRLSVGPFSGAGVARTGQRVVISQNKIEVFDSANVRRIVLGDLS
jgi:hypothetical protein